MGDDEQMDRIYCDRYEVNMDQLYEMKEVWSLFDKKKDGQLPATDISTLLRAMGQNPREEEIVLIMQHFDANEKQQITFEDFARQATKRGLKSEVQSEEELREAFRYFDKDLSGFLNFEQLREVLTKQGEVITDEEMDEMMKDADLDLDGKLNYEEFVRKLATK